MSSRVRSPPPIGYRLELVKDPLYQEPRHIMRDRLRLIVLLVGLVLVTVTIYLTWPSTVEDPTGDRVFEGEVTGNLATEGVIWGECASELDYVSLNHWSHDLGSRLLVNVTNVSNVRLVDYTSTNISVPCENGSFQVIVNNGEFGAYLSDLAFECEYLEFNILFLGDNAVYTPRYIVTSVEGHGNLVHGQNHRWDVTMHQCVVIVDGIEHRGVDSLFIPKDETPYVEVHGDVDPERGNIGVWSGLHPHINGTLDVDDFLHEKDGRTQLYRRIIFRGEDIFVNYTGPSGSLTDRDPGAPFRVEIKVFISPDTTVWVEEVADTPLWVEAILIALIIILVIFTIKLVGRMRSKG